MLINYPVIRVIVPTFNNADELDATVESILAQDYDFDKIFIAFVDFGSTDGTREKLMRYRQKQTGVFCLAGKRFGRTMIADAARMYNLQRIGKRELLLWPGDVIYPHCFKTAENWMHTIERQHKYCSLLVAEADIRDQNGAIRKQSPLFTRPCRIRGYSVDSGEYAQRGYKHAVLTYGLGYSTDYSKGDTRYNQRYIWNHLISFGLYINTLYINESLGCFKERIYSDELDELLNFFETGLSCFRMAREAPDAHVIDGDFELGYRQQLARYALWRAWLLYGRQRIKEAEDCFLFAGVIWPGIYNEECWRAMERLVEHGEESAQIWLEAYFCKDEAPAEPKWPVGGIFTTIWQNLRQRFSLREKQSAWGSQ
jgi:glycosyltransferase involved in cell wall biosynthesis